MYQKYNITGMACASCQNNIQKTISKMRGVRNVNVNLVSASMTLDYDENKTSSNAIIDKVKSIGYGAVESDELQENTTIQKQQVKKN